MEAATVTEQAEADEFVQACFARGFAPPLEQSIYEWARENIEMDATAPIPGPYRIEFTPQMREPLEAYQDESVRHIVTVGPNQGGRTKGMEMALYWSISNRPGPTQWNTDTNPKAKDFAEERFWQSVQDVPEIRNLFPFNHDKKRTQKVIWRNGCPLVMQGANLSNFQQKSIKNQFNDEVFEWKQGLLKDAHIRCEVSYAWNHKIWDSSVPGNAEDDIDTEWQDSSMGEWSFACRACGCVQAFKWGSAKEKGGIKFDRNEVTKPGGVWDMDEMRKTVRYECEAPECKEVYIDRPSSRHEMNTAGRYVHKHPNRKTRGFRYNILCVNWPGVSWGQWVKELLNARLSAKLFYNIEPLRLFWTRRMAQWWEEDKFLAMESHRKTADYKLRADDGSYNFKTTKWGEEWGRFMAVDKQMDYYRFVIRACKADGTSRMIYTGDIDSYAGIDGVAKEWGVVPGRVIIDCSFEQNEVFAAAVKYGWVCFRGVDRDEGFDHYLENKQTGEKYHVVRPYSEKKWGDPGGGTRMQQRNRGVAMNRLRLAKVYHWSNLLVKNAVSAFKQGRVQTYWGQPSDAPEFYDEEMDGETRYRITNARGKVTYFWSNAGRDGKAHKKANHAWDCECMIFCGMIMAGLIEMEFQIPSNEIPAQGTAEDGKEANGQAA